jgi:hypothetical protein
MRYLRSVAEEPSRAAEVEGLPMGPVELCGCSASGALVPLLESVRTANSRASTALLSERAHAPKTDAMEGASRRRAAGTTCAWNAVWKLAVRSESTGGPGSSGELQVSRERSGAAAGRAQRRVRRRTRNRVQDGGQLRTTRKWHWARLAQKTCWKQGVSQRPTSADSECEGTPGATASGQALPCDSTAATGSAARDIVQW